MELETVSYQEVIDGYNPVGDEYGLAAYAIAEPRKKAFLSNPNLTDTSKVMIKLMRDNGKIIGRNMMFPSRFKSGDDIIETVGGSSLSVAKEYRNGEAGGILMSYNIRHKENNAVISSGFTAIAAKCHKALRAYMLCFPQLIQIRDFRKVLPGMGLNSIISNVVGTVLNCVLWPFLGFVKIKAKNRCKGYQIEEVHAIPEWIDDIVLNDGHKYMEVHDHRWFQWNLDNMFHSHPRNINHFFTVSKGGEKLGFFMIKERNSTVNSESTSEMVSGTICEWGTNDNSRLNEYDLHVIALNYFSKNVDVVFMATNDNEVVNKMKRFLFFRRNEAKIAFYDLKKEHKDAKDINLWRVRLGYGDSILN